ncbi:MAG TPA: peptide ligase PGM1-related protein, partial [Steroidobacteraceae bacterium]|nr:peptide ligase PGM1-related protein [Steroidobacteraceae bacterium]
CTFPADPAYALEIQRLALRVGDVLKRHGVLGRFGVDFVSLPRNGGWQHFAIEINLRKGGTTHTFQMLQFLAGGRYDPERAEFVTPAGDVRCYYATDNVVSPAYRRLTPEDLFEIAGQRGLRFNGESQTGVVFMLVGALSEFGKLGVVAIDVDRDAARRRFRGAVAALDEETATPPAA